VYLALFSYSNIIAEVLTMTMFFIITFSGLWHCILLYVSTKGVEKPDAVIIKVEDGGSWIS